MAGTKFGSFFHSAFPAGFPAQLSPCSHAEPGKNGEGFSCFSSGLFPPLPNTPFQG